MKRWFLLIVVLFVAILATNDVFAQGCSQCRLMAEQGSELDEGSFGSNINTGILYLMIAPYLLIMFLFRKRIFNFFRSLAKK
jgi:hypothetical protein